MQRKFLPSLLTSLLLGAAPGSQAAKVFFISEGSARSFTIPASAAQVGHTATFMACAERMNDNYLHIVIYLIDPEGTRIGQVIMDTKVTASVSLIKTTRLIEGNYTVSETGNGDNPNNGEIVMATAVDWDEPGDDITHLQEDWNHSLEDLRNELNGTLNTQTEALNQKLAELQKKLDDAIAGHDADQAAILKKIADYEKELEKLGDDLNDKIAVVEKEQDDFQDRLEELENSRDQEKQEVDARIEELNSKYAAEVKRSDTEIARLRAQQEELDSKFSTENRELKAQLDELTSRQSELQKQLEEAQAGHDSDIAEVQQQIEARSAEITAAHNADIQKLNRTILELEGKYAVEVKALNSEMDRINAELGMLEQSYQAADQRLQAQIDPLKERVTFLQAQQAAARELHDRDFQELQSRIVTATETVTAAHQADIKLLTQSITAQEEKYAGQIADVNNRLEKVNAQVDALKTEIAAGNRELQEELDDLTAEQFALKERQNSLRELHNRDIAELQRRIEDKNASLQERIDNATSGLQDQLNSIDGKYRDVSAELYARIESANAEIAGLREKFSREVRELQEQITAGKLERLTLETQFAAATEKHDREVAELQNQISGQVADLQAEIDAEVAVLNQQLVTLEHQYRETAATLKEQLEAVNKRLETDLDKLDAADRELYDKIAELREKQVEYDTCLENIRVIHDKDLEALQKELKAIDEKYRAKIEELDGKIAELSREIETMKEENSHDSENIRKLIEEEIGKLDSEIRNLYQELAAEKAVREQHLQETARRFDMLEKQLTALDAAVVERLKSLENRIRYTVYSDEKLEALKQELEAKIQTKETEIADLDLEIKVLETIDADATEQRERRKRKLLELEQLRNELADLEFGLKLRQDDSEFAAHEKEIAQLKADLAALRNSAELQLKQLRDELLAAEERYLKLLEEVKAEAAGQNAALQKQLDDLTEKVLAFVDTLRSEQKTGDTELKELLEALDASHKELIANLDGSIADKLEQLKLETDTRFEDFRAMINDIAYQQRFSSGGSGNGYSLPAVQVQEIPADTRDLRVSPDASLDSILN